MSIASNIWVRGTTVDLGEGWPCWAVAFLEHSFLEIGRRHPSLAGAEAALEVKGRRRRPSWGQRVADGVEAHPCERRRRQPSSDGGRGGGRAEALEVRGIGHGLTQTASGAEAGPSHRGAGSEGRRRRVIIQFRRRAASVGICCLVYGQICCLIYGRG
jgi:hypothetical protein